jgi:cyclophilin family peptidyl-prolyl cis-trans isomerase
MSKQSKSKRDQKKRLRTRAAAVSAQRQREAQSERDWTLWLWVGGIAAVALVVGGILWFTVGPGRSTSPEPAAPAEESSTGSAPMPADPAERNNMYSAPPAMQIDPEKTYVATLETEKGDIVVELFAEQVPNTVNNFVFLAREGFYDNTTFHRVLEGFMAQAGDPTGTGAGGPGYRFADEFHPDLKHDLPGILSMANSGANTNGSQFFITYLPTPWLDAYDTSGNLKDCQQPGVSCHAVFGRVTEGMDVLESLTLRDSSQNPSFPGDLIQTIRIEER